MRAFGGVLQQMNNSDALSIDLKTYLVTEHLSHVSLPHDLSPPVEFKHGVLDDDRESSQDERQEEVCMNVVSGAMKLPVGRQRSIKI